MTTATQEHAAPLPGTGALMYGLLIGAVAWKVQLMTNYALVPYACWRELGLVIHATSLGAVLLALSGARVAWRSWQRLGPGSEPQSGGPAGRSRFLALSGLALSAFFALLILGQWMPNLLLSPCDGIG